MKKSILFRLLALGIIFSSCKKKDNTTSNSGGGSTSSGGFTNVYGTMLDIQNLTYNKITTKPDTSYSAMAWFFNVAQNNWIFGGINTTTSAGNVSLNNTKLQYISISGIISLYSDSTGTLNLKINNSWQAVGSSPIPGFAYSPAVFWPTYTAYAQMPDTIHKTQDNKILLSSITGADSISVSVSDGSNTSGHSYTSGKVTPSASSITILAAHTTGLNNTASGTLTISLYKFASVQSFGAKNFIFIKDVEFQKTVEIDNF